MNVETMTLRRLILGLLMATWVAAIIVAIGASPPLRAGAGLLLVLVFPGVLTTYAVLPTDSEVDWRLRVVLSVALSLSIALGVGLVLALASSEISRIAGAVALGLVSTTAASIALVRDNGGTALVRPPVPRISPAIALVTGGLFLACAALVVVTLNVNSLPGNFTALTLAQQNGVARMVAENHEGRPMSFRYALRGDGRILRSGQIRVGDEADRVLLISIPPGLRRLDGVLYDGSQRPFRSVRLWLGGRNNWVSRTAAP